MSKLLILLFFIILRLNCVDSQFDLIVARNCSGHFTQISTAIEAVPSNQKNRFTIKVKAGHYKPFIVPKDKTNISLIGDGVDSTVADGHKSNKSGYHLMETATVQIHGADFVAKGITFSNSAGPTMGQAVALLVDAPRAAFYRCRVNGYQDTLYVKNGYQFYRECQIYGTIDFIFGNSQALLQNSVIFLHQPAQNQTNVITAQSRNSPKEGSGIVLQNCTISAARDFHPSSGVETFLGRPWGNYSTTVVMESYLPKFINARGWLDWDNRSLYRRDMVSYKEYKNWGPGAMTDKRVIWKGVSVIRNDSEAKKYTVRNFLNGSAWLPSTHVPYYLDLYR